MGGVNRMIVVGQVGKYGVEVRYSHTGTPCAIFTLAVSELG
jgi:single stranded DNA-binding protein